MQLMRHQLKRIFPRVNDAHAGLLMQRGLTDWEDSEKSIKAQLINTIANVTASDLYVQHSTAGLMPLTKRVMTILPLLLPP